MRLTLSALLCAALLSSPALAHNHDGERMPPPPGVDLPPPPGFDGPDPRDSRDSREGYGDDGGYRGNDDRRGPPTDPRWAQDQDRMRGEWMARCGHHGPEHADRNGPDHDNCGYPGPQAPYGYGYPGGYPGAYMGYAVPMIMVPVLRSKPCPQVVEEYVDEVAPVRRRMIRPRAHVAPVVHDKRVRITDKRVRIAPSKRIAY